jgi:hypothetical protein
MTTLLVNYLVKLDTSPEEARAFKKNPKAAMRAAGLSNDHQAILASRDPGKIRQAVLAERPFPTLFCPIIRPF